MTSLPLPQSFWIVEDALLAGQYPGHKDDTSEASRKLRALLDAGVTAFVDLTHAYDGMTPYKPQLHKLSPLTPYVNLPIVDNSIPSSTRQMARILDLLDAEIERGGLVYLHCWGGHGRTNTVAGCWLRRHGRSPQEALEELKLLRERYASDTWRSDGPQTTRQSDYIRNWAEPPDLLNHPV